MVFMRVAKLGVKNRANMLVFIEGLPERCEPILEGL